MRLWVKLFLASSVFLLSGCEHIEQIKDSLPSFEMPKVEILQDTKKTLASLPPLFENPCPQAKTLSDLSSVTQFINASEMADKMISSTKLEDIHSVCQVTENAVTVDLELNFSGVLGPVGVKDLNGQANYTYPYFLSVVSPEGKIISKDVFALSMVYENGQISYHRQDKLRQTIPLLNGQKASDLQVIVGFQLSESELAYNRRPK